MNYYWGVQTFLSAIANWLKTNKNSLSENAPNVLADALVCQLNRCDYWRMGACASTKNLFSDQLDNVHPPHTCMVIVI